MSEGRRAWTATILYENVFVRVQVLRIKVYAVPETRKTGITTDNFGTGWRSLGSVTVLEARKSSIATDNYGVGGWGVGSIAVPGA